MDALRAGNMRSRRLLQLNEEPARAAPSDQAALTGALTSAVTMGPSSADEMRFLFALFPLSHRCLRAALGESSRWPFRLTPAIKGYWRTGTNRADAPHLPLTPEVVDAHLQGEAFIGLYPLSDDDTCWSSVAPWQSSTSK